ncbi:MAG: hypothetical protein GY786_11610 [Proteobacteria bacterium]|nr:hypothetical protein [Pseudomonadota bacterium]
MWKLLSTIATILSFVTAFYLWSKIYRKVEDDPYYHYGDSMYRGDMKKEDYDSTPPDMDDLENPAGNPIFDETSQVVH